MSRTHHEHRTHNKRLGDRRLKDVVTDFDDRRKAKDRRGFWEEVRRIIFDRRQEETEVEIDRRLKARRTSYRDQRRTLADRRMVDMATDTTRERRKAARRQAEIDRLAALDPTMSAQIAPDYVEKDLNRNLT